MNEELDGCDIDYNEDLLLEDPLLFALFPNGEDKEAEATWKELFNE